MGRPDIQSKSRAPKFAETTKLLAARIEMLRGKRLIYCAELDMAVRLVIIQTV
jgi:hypothetical protein